MAYSKASQNLRGWMGGEDTQTFLEGLGTKLLFAPLISALYHKT